MNTSGFCMFCHYAKNRARCCHVGIVRDGTDTTVAPTPSQARAAPNQTHAGPNDAVRAVEETAAH